MRFRPILPDLAAAIHIAWADHADLAWPGASQPLELHHSDDDGREVGDGAFNHLVLDRA